MASYTQKKDSTSFATEAPPSRAAPEYTYRDDPPHRSFGLVDILLRVFLFACALAVVIIMATSKQKIVIPVPFPPFRIPREAEFKNSPAFTYLMAAAAVTGLYSLITTLVSLLALRKSSGHLSMVYHFVIFDVLLLGIVSAATGAAGAVAYIGLKGNSHTQWLKICNRFDIFCKHIGASVALSLGASVILALLVLRSVRSLSKRIPK